MRTVPPAKAQRISAQAAVNWRTGTSRTSGSTSVSLIVRTPSRTVSMSKPPQLLVSASAAWTLATSAKVPQTFASPVTRTYPRSISWTTLATKNAHFSTLTKRSLLRKLTKATLCRTDSFVLAANQVVTDATHWTSQSVCAAARSSTCTRASAVVTAQRAGEAATVSATTRVTTCECFGSHS